MVKKIEKIKKIGKAGREKKSKFRAFATRAKKTIFVELTCMLNGNFGAIYSLLVWSDVILTALNSRSITC